MAKGLCGTCVAAQTGPAGQRPLSSLFCYPAKYDLAWSRDGPVTPDSSLLATGLTGGRPVWLLAERGIVTGKEGLRDGGLLGHCPSGQAREMAVPN